LRAASLFFAFAFAAAAMLVRVGSSARAASSQCGRRSLSVNFFSQLFACALVLVYTLAQRAPSASSPKRYIFTASLLLSKNLLMLITFLHLLFDTQF
jgi:hypothetical protein